MPNGSSADRARPTTTTPRTPERIGEWCDEDGARFESFEAGDLGELVDVHGNGRLRARGGVEKARDLGHVDLRQPLRRDTRAARGAVHDVGDGVVAHDDLGDFGMKRVPREVEQADEAVLEVVRGVENFRGRVQEFETRTLRPLREERAVRHEHDGDRAREQGPTAGRHGDDDHRDQPEHGVDDGAGHAEPKARCERTNLRSPLGHGDRDRDRTQPDR